MLNPQLSMAHFTTLLTPQEQSGFRPGNVRVVLLSAGMRLFKLTGYGAFDGRAADPNNPGRVPRLSVQSPWWSPVKKFEEDRMGAIGRLQEAEANGLSLKDMVRFASCVKYNWNNLENYVEIMLSTPAYAFWGQFAPMGQRDDGAIENPNFPELLGGLDDAWQLYIPGMRGFHYKTVTSINATDHAALRTHLAKQVVHGRSNVTGGWQR